MAYSFQKDAAGSLLFMAGWAKSKWRYSSLLLNYIETSMRVFSSVLFLGWLLLILRAIVFYSINPNSSSAHCHDKNGLQVIQSFLTVCYCAENLIPCWVHHGSLPPPHPSTPLILIGPGTGCAPFCAFVAERAAQSTSEATAPILFFFGCRNQENDFLYKDFWYAHAHDQGVLSSKNGGGFFVAFSRDQPQKVYVQHRIREQSARVWNLLKSGAAIYIAGSSTKMPADVTAALEEVICQETGCSEEEASIWLRKLERNGKFHTETWS